MALYADDTKIWREIVISEDHFILQNDIDNLYKWSVDNKMNFHPSKCKALSLTNQRNILHNLPFTIFHYRLDSAQWGNLIGHYDFWVFCLFMPLATSWWCQFGLNRQL